jgi:hypothetical protein
MIFMNSQHEDTNSKDDLSLKNAVSNVHFKDFCSENSLINSSWKNLKTFHKDSFYPLNYEDLKSPLFLYKYCKERRLIFTLHFCNWRDRGRLMTEKKDWIVEKKICIYMYLSVLYILYIVEYFLKGL